MGTDDAQPFRGHDEAGERGLCAACPARRLPAGRFDVHERPGPDSPFDPATGDRVGPGGVAVCVHPFRIGVPPGRYASADEPFPRYGPAKSDPAPDSAPDSAPVPERSASGR